MMTDQEGKYTFEITTGDITGEFRVIIQGVNNEGLFFGDSKIVIE